MGNLDSIRQVFYIRENNNLANFTGLDNLHFLNNFAMYDNDARSSFEGMENLRSIEGNLSVVYSDSLINFNGLEDLNAIGGNLYISDNAILASLSGLDNLDYTTIGHLTLTYNRNLSFCSIPPICNYLFENGEATIYYNAEEGCGFAFQIEEGCEAVSAKEAGAETDVIKIFPIPATNHLRFKLPQGVSGPITLQLFDAQGRLVRQETATPGQSISVEGMARGLYVVKGVVDEVVYVGRFVKE
ncbi:MAG: T9SS type A sorting domain-containing protein [Lewinellaceae bacterium]|nr:T9SS type A sorting domain-containing protein [Lewinellaceae bacterium]